MKNNWHYLLLVLLLIVIFWPWWTQGAKVALDFSYNSDNLLKTLLDVPRTWSEKYSEGLGEYTVFTLWSYPMALLSGLLANLGLNFSQIERILFLSFIFIGSISIAKFTQRYNFSPLTKLISSLFYLSNTYIVLVLDGGQIAIGLAYAIFPLCFLLIEKALAGLVKDKIIAGLAVSFLGFLDIRFIYVLLILIFLHFVFNLRKVKQYLYTGVVISTIVIGLHSYWLLPLIKEPLSSQYYKDLTQTSFSSFSTLGHSLLMLSPHWYKNIFGVVTPLRVEFLLIPLLVFLAPILKSKNKDVAFWLVVAMVSLFLTKGTLEPIPQVYPWLYDHIPGFSFLRDSTKFYFLLCLSYTTLLGISLEVIIKKFSKYQAAITLVVICYLLLLIHPVVLGQMNGTLSTPLMQEEYSTLSRVIKEDQKFSRVFWIPYTQPLTYSDATHPIVEASRLVQKRPFAIGTVGIYERYNFLREATFTGELFDVLGIGYIAYPYLDKHRDNMHPDNIKYYYTFLNQISNLPWIEKQVSSSQIPLFKTRNHQNKFFLADNSWVIIGSDDIYKESTKSAKLRLTRNGLIFAEEKGGMGYLLKDLPFAKVVLNNKTNIDLAAIFISPESLIFPAKDLNLHPKLSGWWKRDGKDVISWRDFLQTKYGIDNFDFDLGGGWAVGEGSLKLKVKNEKFKIDYKLLARVLESTRSGQINFYQDNQLIGTIDTAKQGNNFKWFEVGKLVSNDQLTIEASGDINVVNALAVLDATGWENLKLNAYQFGGRISQFKAMTESTTVENPTTLQVVYQQINPTKYLVKVLGLTKPSLLVFSQTYDPRWKMKDQYSMPVYTILNGFKVEKDGEYQIYFEPQKYVYPGLVISGVTLFTCIIFLKIKFPQNYF